MNHICNTRYWARVMETVDVIYPEGPGGSYRIVVDVIHYREREEGVKSCKYFVFIYLFY